MVTEPSIPLPLPRILAVSTGDLTRNVTTALRGSAGAEHVLKLESMADVLGANCLLPLPLSDP